jgi:peroxiredoxin
MRKIGWFIIPLGLVVVAFVSVCNARSAAQDPTAPDFALKDLNGTEWSLSDFEGKVLFMNFWATWCPPCRAEIPDFIEVYDKYKDTGMAILGVSLDQIGERKVSEFAERLQVNYPMAMATRQLFQDYPAPRAIPTTLVIDGMGKIRYTKVGLMTKQELIDLYLRFKR